MRLIKVTYRAVFEQPQGKLNPMGCKLPGPCPVEVYGGGQNWQVREIATSARRLCAKLGTFTSHERACNSLAEVFAHQTEPWQTWGTPPPERIGERTSERMLEPWEIAELSTSSGRKTFWKQAEDFTHILHAPTMDPGAKVPPAACGAKVRADCFINNKANVEPTCRKCAEVWRQHYQEKQA